MNLPTRVQVLTDIDNERNRQDEIHGEQHHSFGTWLKILVEEVGEVAEAMQLEEGWTKDTDANNLYTELIQVAAVAMAIAEQVKNND